MPSAVFGSSAVFLFALRAFFRSVGRFLFVGACSCMPFLFSGVLWRFRGIVGGVFGLGVAFVSLLFALACSVIGQILLVSRFAGVGSILYRVIFCRS
jgi:hypothetical protein